MDALSFLLEQAIDPLMELTGERAGEEILQQVFANFCVGK